MPSSRFPHIELIKIQSGRAKLEGGGSKNAAVEDNKNDRPAHSTLIVNAVESFSEKAKHRTEQRETAGLPTISSGVPFMLQVPTEDEDALDFVAKKMKLEIVAEYDDGFLIVSTTDLDLQAVRDLTNDFLAEKRGSGGMAKILNVEEDPASERRLGRIMGADLMESWPLAPDEVFTLDVSVEVAAFDPPGKPRGITKRTSAEKKAEKLRLHAYEMAKFASRWDDERITREAEVNALVQHYGGEVLSIVEDGVVDFPDSFAMRIRMSGRGFTDLIVYFPSLFEVCLPEDISNPIAGVTEEEFSPDDFELLPASESAPLICVIDSGMQENHRWLAGAVKTSLSHCFIPGKNPEDVADYVEAGGHGTRVAGTCLYPKFVPRTGEFEAPFHLVNARVLNEDNKLIEGIFPADLLGKIVGRYRESSGVRIYQHSIASRVACPITRMSVWACAIDLLSFQKDVLFIQAVGNLSDRSDTHLPGIREHLEAGRSYPDYLTEPSSRLANPAQSLQALTVGSISKDVFSDGFRMSISPAGNPSSFTRMGFGLWDTIKPEVVEVGGDFAVTGTTPPLLTTPAAVCPETIRSTLDGGPAIAQDSIGTSLAAPKVTHIAGCLATLFPEYSTLLYRALIVNSARWPDWAEQAAVNERPNVVRALGYGVPSLERATENSETRVTLITEATYEAKSKEGFIFGVPIPDGINRPGKNFDVRIDVTLSYATEPRRTRKSRRGYQGVWLDWKASKKGESFSTFSGRALVETDSDDGSNDGNFAWTMGNKKSRDGLTEGVTRKNGTVQKDWTIAKSYELPDMFGIIVRGHPGWDQDEDATAKFTVVVSFESLDPEEEIYQQIEAAVQTEVEARQNVVAEAEV